jgi:hypothetical protein
MAEVNLPHDLIFFLRSGDRLSYDASACEAGEIRFLPVDKLVVEYFPMDPAGSDDPHADENGSYLVKGVSLIDSCDDYDPKGLLLWLPLDQRFGIWDGEHGTLVVFSPSVTWSQIASDLPRYINAGWGFDDSEPVQPLTAWKLHPYNSKQLSWPLSDIEEWYEGRWTRRGIHRDGVQIRYPKEAEIRIERHLGQITATAKVKPAEPEADWSSSTRALSTEEWQSLQSRLSSGFWEQTEHSSVFVSEPVTIWSLSGFRDNRYHAVHREFDETTPAADSVNELGKQLLKVAGLEGFDDKP